MANKAIVGIYVVPEKLKDQCNKDSQCKNSLSHVLVDTLLVLRGYSCFVSA